MSAHFLRTSEEKHREADARIDERTKGRLLLLNQEEKELAVRPVLPWPVPFHGSCA